MVSKTNSKRESKTKDKLKSKNETKTKDKLKLKDKLKPKSKLKDKAKNETKSKDKSKSESKSKSELKVKDKPKKVLKQGLGLGILTGLTGIGLLAMNKGKKYKDEQKKSVSKSRKVKIFTKLNEIPDIKTETNTKSKYQSPTKLNSDEELENYILPKDYDYGKLDFEKYKDSEEELEQSKKYIKNITELLKREKEQNFTLQHTESESESESETEQEISKRKKISKKRFNMKDNAEIIKKTNEEIHNKKTKYLKTITKILKTKEDSLNNILSIPFAEDYIGEWTGNLKTSRFFLIEYLVNKYKNICCTPTDLAFLFSVKTNNIIIQYTNTNKSINSSYNDPQIKNIILKLSQMCPTKRFIIIPITIDNKLEPLKAMYYINEKVRDIHRLHSNMLIYDRTKNIIEHFEPHGYNETYSNVYKNIQKMFNFLNVKYKSPSIVCPGYGPQSGDLKCLSRIPLFKTIGFCIIWNLWYTELRLLNPDMNSIELIKKYYKHEDELCIFLISYSKFINKFSNKF